MIDEQSPARRRRGRPPSADNGVAKVKLSFRLSTDLIAALPPAGDERTAAVERALRAAFLTA